jgi:uncharacterized glyoxalase superfamily protein PhnB
MPVTRAHFILYVRDQAKSAAFYAAVLGAKPTVSVPGMTEFELTGGSVLGLMPETSVARLLGLAHDPTRVGTTVRAELYLVVDDPDAHHARALAAGATEASPVGPRDWGHDAGYAIDLDGHVIAFARVTPRDFAR